jgi:hypothetical protein
MTAVPASVCNDSYRYDITPLQPVQPCIFCPLQDNPACNPDAPQVKAAREHTSFSILRWFAGSLNPSLGICDGLAQVTLCMPLHGAGEASTQFKLLRSGPPESSMCLPSTGLCALAVRAGMSTGHVGGSRYVSYLHSPGVCIQPVLQGGWTVPEGKQWC